MSIRTTLAHAVALALTLGSSAAPAVTINYTLYAGVLHSDNINLTSTNPVSANVLTPGVGFNLVQQGSTIQAQVAGNIAYRHYLRKNLSDQTQAQLSGRLNWTIAPQRLAFSVEDYAATQPVDNLASAAPANEQQTNLLSLGPTLYFGLGTALRGQAELRYINSYAEDTDSFNSHRGQAALRIIRDLSPTNQLSFNGQFQRADFYRSDTDPNYNRTDVFANYVSHLTRLDIDVAAGWSRIDFHDAQARDSSDPLLRAALTWRMTERSSLTAAGSRQFSDAAAMLQEPRAGQLVGDMGVVFPGNGDFNGGVSGGSTAINSQVFVERAASLSYSYQTERLTLDVTPGYRKLDYVNDLQLNQVGRSASVGIQYRLRPAVTLSAYAYGERLTYQAIDRRDRNMEYQVSVTHQMTPHWSWNASVLHRNRDSNLPLQDYHENQIYFGLAFTR